jgi:hypothetical protein
LQAGVVALCLLPCFCPAQPRSELGPTPPLPAAEGEKVARQLIGDLLVQQPTEGSVASGTMTVREHGQERQQGLRFSVVVTPTNYATLYQTIGGGKGTRAVELKIIHAPAEPNEYFLSDPAGAGSRHLSRDQIMTPFAGSDFWVADLGLEFLHWPQQRVLKKEMRKSQFCDLLESVDPSPVPGGYARVEAWIGANHPDEVVLVHADAFDATGKRVKEFDPKKVQKVNGAWQLAEMDMRNVQTGSRTRVEFHFDTK